ncbi:hypothetical protein TNCV_4220861 [Trichonephila clavipes]|nr:hypothetical protein TNCV_4220861 [Trichonephila clavipes]
MQMKIRKKEGKSLLKRLAGDTWGSSPNVLATTYKFCVRSFLDCGGEHWPQNLKAVVMLSLEADLAATNFDVEIEAVRQAIRHLTNLSTSYRRTVYFVDSQSVILTFCSYRNSDSRGNEKDDSLEKNGYHRIQEDDSRGKFWEYLVHSVVPMGIPRYVFSAVFRVLTGYDFLQQHLHRIGVKDTPYCPLCLGRGYEFHSPDSVSFPGRHRD